MTEQWNKWNIQMKHLCAGALGIMDCANMQQCALPVALFAL